MVSTTKSDTSKTVRETCSFRVADLLMSITFIGYRNGFRLLPSFAPFKTEKSNDEQEMFSLIVDDGLKPMPKSQRERIRAFDTGNGETVVDKLSNGGYQYIITDINSNDCALLITDENFKNCKCALNGNAMMRSFGLNNAIMLVYAFAGAYNDTILLHASVVRNNGRGYAFIAKSGTGKSTQVSNWLKYIPECDLMNDDNPVVRIVDGKCYIYGSPWSGKTPCYRNVKALLGAITQIDRSTSNSVERLPIIQAFASLLVSVSTMKWETSLYQRTCSLLARIMEIIPIYILHCLPDRNSAEVCHKTLVIDNLIESKQGIKQ